MRALPNLPKALRSVSLSTLYKSTCFFTIFALVLCSSFFETVLQVELTLIKKIAFSYFIAAFLTYHLNDYSYSGTRALIINAYRLWLKVDITILKMRLALAEDTFRRVKRLRFDEELICGSPQIESAQTCFAPDVNFIAPAPIQSPLDRGSDDCNQTMIDKAVNKKGGVLKAKPTASAASGLTA